MTTKRVYFIECGEGGPIKIGVAINVADRMHTLQAANPTPLRLIVSVPGDYEDERRLHRHFAHERLHREWFRGDGDVRRFAELIAHEDMDSVYIRLLELPTPRARAVVELRGRPEPIPEDPIAETKALLAQRRRKTSRKRQPDSVRLLTPEQRHAMLFVGDGTSGIFRSEDAEQYLRDEDARRARRGLPPLSGHPFHGETEVA